MDIKYTLILILICSLSCRLQEKEEFKKFTYCTNEQKYCIKTIIDTSELNGNYFRHSAAETSIREFEKTEPIGYKIIWGNYEPNDDWGPSTKYSLDTILTRKKLGLIYSNKPIYFIRFNTVNDRKYLTICNEQYGMGIIIHSNYYSDSLNILIQTTYINQYNYSKINQKKHFDLLENTEIVIK